MIKTIFLAAWSNRTPFWKFLIKHIAQLYFTPWLGHNIIIAKGGFLAFFRWFSFSSWLLHLFNVLTRARVCTTVICLKNCRKIMLNLIPDGFPSRQAQTALECNLRKVFFDKRWVSQFSTLIWLIKKFLYRHHFIFFKRVRISRYLSSDSIYLKISLFYIFLF